MADKKDYIKTAIAEKLAPVLVQNGFVRFKPKHFIRVEGDLTHSIAFQMSRYGDQRFYVHYHVNLLCAPSMDIESYRIGKRIGHHEESLAEWVGDSEENASRAVGGVIAAAQEDILPWFASVRNVRDFIVERVANPETQIEKLDLAVALLRAGYRNRAWWICDAMSKEETYVSPIDNWDRTCMAYATELMNALDSDAHDELLTKWKRENIERNKLSSLFETKVSKKV